MTRDPLDLNLADAVRRVIVARVPGLDASSASDEMSFGAEGLGFDSITTVEVLLECEAACGVVLPRELLAGAPLTVGALIGAVRDARSHATDT